MFIFVRTDGWENSAKLETRCCGKHSKKERNSRKTEYERRVLNARNKNYDEKVVKRKEGEREKKTSLNRELRIYMWKSRINIDKYDW